MGCFSWVLIDERKELMMGHNFKMLIPKEFGGGSIISNYDDYGNFNVANLKFDLYEILAFWNRPTEVKGTPVLFGVRAANDHNYGGEDITSDNRSIGIDIACYDNQHATMKYPLRLVSEGYAGTYEDLEGKFSISAPNQGWDGSTIYDEARFLVASYNTEEPIIFHDEEFNEDEDWDDDEDEE